MDLQNPKTILVVQIGKIGDMILTTPLFSELKRLFPNSNLKVLSSEINKEISLNSAYVDEVIIYGRNFLKNLLLLKSLFKKIDIWIDTKDNYSKTSKLLVKFFKPKLSMGFNFGETVFDVSLNNLNISNHAVYINLSPVNYFEKNVTMEQLRPTFDIPEKVQKRFDSEFKNNQKRKILVNISAGSESRYLETKKWIEIIKKINNAHTSSFTLMGLAIDSEQIDYILKNLRTININYIETNNILEAAEIVCRNDLVITADTSIVHICSAFNKPVIAMYPDVKWNLEKFAPLSNHNEIIVSKDEASIKSIESEEVVERYFRLNEKINSGNAESRTRVRKEDH